MPPTTTPATCAALNRRGEPCGAAPLRGGSLCAAHDPTVPFGSPDQTRVAGRLGGRPPRERSDAQRVLEEIAEIMREAGIVPVYGEDGQSRAGAYATRRGHHKLRDAR
jgi:hypothetical protein